MKAVERPYQPVQGMRSRELLHRLHLHESRNVTYSDDEFPVVWERANGAFVTDVDGHRYIDCTSAFGVTNVGHCNPRVVAAVARQARQLIHAMGDVAPAAIRVGLLERLTAIVPKPLERVIFGTSGSDAIEAALKTAMIATGKPRVAAYRNGYHGLSFGALMVAGIPRFRQPFQAAFANDPLLLEFPRAGSVSADRAAQTTRANLLERSDVAAIVIEPIQGRAGVIVPPTGYLSALRSICDEMGIVMIVDEIYTGFGRTGNWFAIDAEAVIPDILCVGKAMGAGVPISAAVGRATIMNSWPPPTGEALHTSTHLGDPLGCAAALATIEELTRLELPARAARLGLPLRERLENLYGIAGVVAVRGRGFFWGIELENASLARGAVKAAMAMGVLFLQSGVCGETITFAPPLIIEEAALWEAVAVLRRSLRSPTGEITPKRS